METCTVDGCDAAVFVKSRGLCKRHYGRWHRHGDPTVYVKVKKICTVDDCHLPRDSHGLCAKHTARLKRYGTTDLPPRPILPTICIIDGCGKDVESSGLCTTHRARARKRGSAEALHGCRQCGKPIVGAGSAYCGRQCREHWEYWDRKSKQRARQLKIYGLTVEQFDAMLTGQGSACAICRRTEPGSRGWCVDHCHDTGKVRGILCMNCNAAIGHLGDDPGTLRAAIAYLER